MSRLVLSSALTFALTTAISSVVCAQSAEAEAPGLGAVAVKVDWATKSLEHKGCPTKPCRVPGGQKIAIDLPGVNDAQVTVEAVNVGEERAIVHALVRAKGSEATWEALVAPAEGGGSQVLFAGPTGFVKGEPGERRGDAIARYPREDNRSQFVVVGSLVESISLCGEPRTLVAPRALDARTMTLRSAAVQQLPRERRARAVKLTARVRKEAPEKPLGRYLAPGGTSDGRTSAAPLVDNNVATRWFEQRSGIGTGEIAVLRSTPRIAVTRLAIVPAPAAPAEKGKPDLWPEQAVAPKSLFVVTDKNTYVVELPEDATKSRASFEIALPEPIKSSCVALVLDDAFTRNVTKPEVSISEVVAYGDLDTPGATLEQVARSLGKGGQNAELAGEVLKRGGPEAAKAIAAAYDTLDERGRSLALEVASAAGGCEGAAPVFLRALADPEKDVAARAEKLLLSCGNAVTPTLIDVVEKAPPPDKARAAGVLSLIAPSRSLRAIGLVLGQGDVPTRAALRSAYARAAKRASPEQLVERFAETKADTRPDMLRALSGRLGDIRDRASAAVSEWLDRDTSFEARFLALEPLGELARAGDTAATTRFVAVLGSDKEWPVRARAAGLSGPVPAAHGALLRALDDPEPRVREAALRAVGEAGNSPAAVRVGAILAQDPWTFVRVAAASALGGMKPAPDLDRALADALKDKSTRVRVEALEALGRHRANTFAEQVRERLEDDQEPLDVRVTAIGTLGRMCDAESLDWMTKAARRLTLPFPDRNDLDLGVASIKALGFMHPKDLERRLAPLMGKDIKANVREVATRAIAEPGQCR